MALPRPPFTLLLSLAALLCVACDDPTPPAPAADAGILPLDASVSTDAGEQPTDAGEQPADAGTEADAGEQPADAGTEADAGIDDPCQPNPCTDSAGHRTRCLWDGQGGYTCNCDVGFHGSEGLCCPPFSNNVGGSCACNAGYELVGGACVVKCSEDSIEGFNGWCPDGQLCVQGVCTLDVCEGHTCPAHSTCLDRAGEPFCLCESGYDLSDSLCCQEHATNVGGACTCDPGYHLQSGACVANSTNPCTPIICLSAGLHKNTCVLDSSAQGYHCACNQGYELSGTACVLKVYESCPTGSTCRADVCVPHDLSREQCVTDADCREFSAVASTTCNAGAAGGICVNCTEQSDCPGNSQCMPYGTCALMCDSDADCYYGECATALGYCKQSYCRTDADCGAGTVCIDEGGSLNGGMCRRIPCVETACSPTNPTGTCPNAGEACLYGACKSSCSPNPCTQELNKNVCSTASGAPQCQCASGYELAADGRCMPVVTACTNGMTCGGAFCADEAATGFVCSDNADCGAGLTCSPALPSGACRGCDATKPCPGELECLAGYCLQPCATHDECHAEMICRPNSSGGGYCGRKSCSGPADCAAPYVCVAGTDGAGSCQRPICQ